MKVSVLGTPYTIEYRKTAEDGALKQFDGYQDSMSKRIVVKDYTAEDRKDPLSADDLEAYKREVMRHEIVHAFLYESGLDSSSQNAWARNEEIVDWIAIQGPKLYAAWLAAKCL